MLGIFGLVGFSFSRCRPPALCFDGQLPVARTRIFADVRLYTFRVAQEPDSIRWCPHSAYVSDQSATFIGNWLPTWRSRSFRRREQAAMRFIMTRSIGLIRRCKAQPEPQESRDHREHEPVIALLIQSADRGGEEHRPFAEHHQALLWHGQPHHRPDFLPSWDAVSKRRLLMRSARRRRLSCIT